MTAPFVFQSEVGAVRSTGYRADDLESFIHGRDLQIAHLCKRSAISIARVLIGEQLINCLTQNLFHV